MSKRKVLMDCLSVAQYLFLLAVIMYPLRQSGNYKITGIIKYRLNQNPGTALEHRQRCESFKWEDGTVNKDARLLLIRVICRHLQQIHLEKGNDSVC